jgi:hypothetical protein
MQVQPPSRRRIGGSWKSVGRRQTHTQKGREPHALIKCVLRSHQALVLYLGLVLLLAFAVKL